MPPGLIHFAFSDDRRILYILASNGMKDSDKYKLFQLNYEEIVNNLGKILSNRLSTRLEKPENFVCSRKNFEAKKLTPLPFAQKNWNKTKKITKIETFLHFWNLHIENKNKTLHCTINNVYTRMT